jgi:hypothetical protein
MTLAEDIALKDLKTLVVPNRSVPISITLDGPGVREGVPAKDVVKLIRNVEKLLVEIGKQTNPGVKIEVTVRGVDNAGDSFTVRFEISEAPKK